MPGQNLALLAIRSGGAWVFVLTQRNMRSCFAALLLIQKNSL